MLDQKNHPKYVLLAQEANDRLTIGVVGEKLPIIRTAGAVLADKEMLNGFTPEHAAIIGVIGGMSVVEKR